MTTLMLTNVAPQVTIKDIIELFCVFGFVKNVRIIPNKVNPKDNGYAFLELPNKASKEAFDYYKNKIMVSDGHSRMKVQFATGEMSEHSKEIEQYRLQQRLERHLRKIKNEMERIRVITKKNKENSKPPTSKS